MKLCSITCVIAWLAFWAFGFVALTTDPAQALTLMTAMMIAFAGFAIGTTNYLKISREVC